jgi:thioredoxin 2
MTVATTIAICPSCEKLNRVPLDRVSSEADPLKPVCGSCGTALPVHHGVQQVSLRTLTSLAQKTSTPIVIDFWAPWCGPCRMFAPTFEQGAKQMAGQAIFVKLNTEEHPDAGQQFGIRSIPTLAVWKQGKEKNRVSGALPLPDLLRFVQSSSS